MARCRSILRGIQKKLVRLPQISPVPDNVPPANDFNKMLTSAKKIKKENGDAYLGVDTLLQAVIETSKEVQECLNEAGRVSELVCRHARSWKSLQICYVPPAMAILHHSASSGR